MYAIVLGTLGAIIAAVAVVGIAKLLGGLFVAIHTAVFWVLKPLGVTPFGVAISLIWLLIATIVVLLVGHAYYGL